MRQCIILLLLWSFTIPAFAQDTLFEEASVAYTNGDFENAAALFDQLLQKDSLNASAMKYSGYSLQGLGRHKEAVRILSKAVEGAPGDILLRLALARSYEAVGRPEEAGALYREAYQDEYFVEVVDTPPATGHVRGSNFVRVFARYDERTGRITTISVEDNLVKGAAGQAIQAFNIVFGLPEMAGLEQLPIVP